ncbi:MAG: DUF547 domain-containing protein [Pseudomonadota bacterium]
MAAPKAELWARWTEHDASSTVVVDHSSWDRLTRQHLSRGGNGVALLDYAGFDAADRRLLADYIAALEGMPVSQLNRAEQYAYWLNLYNAATVAVVLEHYPVRSIRDIDISPGFFADGPWGAALLSVEGEELSLDDIEHRILRPIWQDPRIHYGVNCASIGCPDLRAGAYTGANVDSALDEAARVYVNHPRGATVSGGRLVVSSIYDWFEDDFGGDDSGVIVHLKRFAEPALAAQLNGISRVSDDEYDWRLNDAKPPAAASDLPRRNQFNGGGGGRGS